MTTFARYALGIPTQAILNVMTAARAVFHAAPWIKIAACASAFVLGPVGRLLVSASALSRTEGHPLAQLMWSLGVLAVLAAVAEVSAFPLMVLTAIGVGGLLVEAGGRYEYHLLRAQA